MLLNFNNLGSLLHKHITVKTKTKTTKQALQKNTYNHYYKVTILFLGGTVNICFVDVFEISPNCSHSKAIEISKDHRHITTLSKLYR